MDIDGSTVVCTYILNEITVRCLPASGRARLGGLASAANRPGWLDLATNAHPGRSATGWLARSGSRVTQQACLIGFCAQQQGGWLDLVHAWLEWPARMACSIAFFEVDGPAGLGLPANASPNA